MKIGFDNALYMEKQKEHILERIASFNGKLYLEFGGKLFDDYHAGRVLPGFEPDVKIRLLRQMSDQVEVVFCISADSIEKTKIRADLGISYDMDLLRQIDEITKMGIEVNSVVITQYTGQSAADSFAAKLTARNVKNYIHRPIAGYPVDVEHIVSDEGYGSNPYIETTKPLVVVTAPGPGSGKLATCLSQVYHENKRGAMAGYGKYETFPIWNLPLKHPVNLAYEAATADLQDLNMIDPFHLEEYGKTTVNYNRDVEAFPIVHTILTKITGNEKFYCSPTDMGVNMAGFGIIDDDACKEASCQEILRRYYKAACEVKQGKEPQQTLDKIKLIMSQLDLKKTHREVVGYALAKQESRQSPAAAIKLPCGKIITGKATKLMSASSGAVLNSIKFLADIPKETLLMDPEILEPVLNLKINLLGSRSSVLKLDDVLTALYICAANNETAKLAVSQLGKLKGCDVHTTQMLHNGDKNTLLKMGLNATSEAVFPDKSLFF